MTLDDLPPLLLQHADLVLGLSAALDDLAGRLDLEQGLLDVAVCVRLGGHVADANQELPRLGVASRASPELTLVREVVDLDLDLALGKERVRAFAFAFSIVSPVPIDSLPIFNSQ